MKEHYAKVLQRGVGLGTDDQNVASAESSVLGEVIASGNPYKMSYATFLTFRDGLIVNYRDYRNPQVFIKANRLFNKRRQIQPTIYEYVRNRTRSVTNPDTIDIFMASIR